MRVLIETGGGMGIEKVEKLLAILGFEVVAAGSEEIDKEVGKQ